MQNLRKSLDSLSIYIIYGFVFALPLVFTKFTTEYYDSAKFFLLSAVVLILFLLWGARILTDGKLDIKRTPLDPFLLIFLLSAFLSTLFSTSKYTSLFGSMTNLHGSLIFLVAVVLLYFLISYNVKNLKQVNLISNLMILSGVLLSVASLLTLFKVTSIPLVGNLQTTSIYIAILLPLCLRNKTVTGIIINLIFAITLSLTGNIAAWLAAGIALIIFFYLNRKHLNAVAPILGVLTVSLVLVILAYAPNLSNKTPLSQIIKNSTREPQLSFNTAWKISAGAFKDYPLLGSGPGTYLYDFTQYKPLEYNNTKNWNTPILNSHDYLLEVWAQLGALGLLSLLALASSFVHFYLKNPEKEGLPTAGLIFILTLSLTPLNTLTQTAGFIILALNLITKDRQQDALVNIQSSNNSQASMSVLAFLPILAAVVLGFYFTGKSAAAEYYHRQAQNATANNLPLKTVYDHLLKAEQLNPKVDLYRTGLAQTNFAIANAIASQKGPTEASPEGSLTDEDKKDIQQFLQQSITEGRSSVTLSPRSSFNWEVLAIIYRQITGVAPNSLQFSLDAYGRAIALNPLNPTLRRSVGEVYYQMKNYDLAVRFFDDAVSLKPDYTDALYDLAIALRDKGSYKDGIAVAEKLVAQLQDNTSSKDYRLASELLADLKTKAPSDTNPTTTGPSSALEQEDLPKVLDLPKPDNIATPAAVKK